MYRGGRDRGAAFPNLERHLRDLRREEFAPVRVLQSPDLNQESPGRLPSMRRGCGGGGGGQDPVYAAERFQAGLRTHAARTRARESAHLATRSLNVNEICEERNSCQSSHEDWQFCWFGSPRSAR